MDLHAENPGQPGSGRGDVILEFRNITKRFSGVTALNNVSFSINRGEIHSLLGENGAGKSTLIKILSGAYLKDSGEILLDGKEADIRNSRAAKEMGIGTVYQETSLVPSLDAVENIFLGDEICRKNSFVLDLAEMRTQTVEVLRELDVSFDVGVAVQYLSTAQQQIIEIARSLIHRHKIIIMDEPTSSLTQKDVKKLFEIIKKLKKNGITIIFISHKLEELEEISDRITILRDGSYMGTIRLEETPMPKVISMMVGREFDINRRPVERPGGGEKVLEAENIVSRDGKVKGVSFSLEKGTILGFAGLIGSGRTELMKVIFGANKPEQGTIRIKGRKIRKMTPEKAVRNGLAYLSEDRKSEGLILGMSIAANISISNLDRIADRSVLNLAKEKRETAAMKDELKIAADSIEKRVLYLSGGNQQKVVVAKWLFSNCDILIFDEPTRGIDVGVRSEIYSIMNRLADEGKSIILVSSDLTEVLSVSNRIAVMSDGKITGELENDGTLTQEKLMSLMLGGI